MYISYYLLPTTLTNEALEAVYANPLVGGWQNLPHDRHQIPPHSWQRTCLRHSCPCGAEPLCRIRCISQLHRLRSPLYSETGLSATHHRFCIVQERLGIPTTAGAMDYNLGCSGYVYGLADLHEIMSINLDATRELLKKKNHERETLSVVGIASVAGVIRSSRQCSLRSVKRGSHLAHQIARVRICRTENTLHLRLPRLHRDADDRQHQVTLQDGRRIQRSDSKQTRAWPRPPRRHSGNSSVLALRCS